MFAHLKIGFLRLLGRPALILGLWLLSLGTAAVALFPALPALYLGLADRPAALKLARGQSDVLWGEVLSRFGDFAMLSPMLLSGAVVAVVLFWLAQALLSGGLVAALLRPGSQAYAPPGQVLACALATGKPMLRLELLGLITLRLPVLLLCGVLGYFLAHGQALVESTASAILVRYVPLLSCALLLWSMASVVLHYARVAYLIQPPAAKKVGAALLRAVRLGTARRSGLGSTLGLGLLAMLSYSALLVAGLCAATWLDQALLVGCAFAVRQLCALGRTILGLSVIAAATEVWHGAPP